MSRELPMSVRDIKTRYWVGQVVESLGFENTKDLMEACQTSSKLGLLYEVTFDRYENGTVPTKDTIRKVDQVVPGSRSWFEDGPISSIPLWRILQGDIEECRKMIETVLKEHYPTYDADKWNPFDKLGNGLEGKAKRLSLLIDSKGDKWKDNWVAESYESYLNDEDETKNLDFSFSVICSIISLYHLSAHLEQIEISLLSEFMIRGLEQKAIEIEIPDQLGNAIKLYTIKNFTLDDLSLKLKRNN